MKRRKFVRWMIIIAAGMLTLSCAVFITKLSMNFIPFDKSMVLFSLLSPMSFVSMALCEACTHHEKSPLPVRRTY